MPTVDTQVIEREITIKAKPETIFPYLTDPEKLQRWFPDEATTDVRVGGSYRLVMAKKDYIASGKYVEVKSPTKLVFTFGWEGDDEPTPAGSSTVEITLTPVGSDTLVKLTHRGLGSEESRQNHGEGWAKYLKRLSIAATGGDPGPDEM
jgi:uncharacterized protein YndB with AHSA1/START domain